MAALLEVESRNSQEEKNRPLRKSGLVPAIIYGHNKENKTIKLSKKNFLKKFSGRIVSNLFLDIKIDNESSPSKTVFVKDVQRSCIRHELEHIDFIEINPGEKLHISIPIVLKGESTGVQNFGGMLQFSTRKIDVECLPKDTPTEIVVNISDLGVGESIHVKDLSLKENIKILTHADVSLVSVIEKAAEKVEEKPEEAATEAKTAKPEEAKKTEEKK